jgi:hypothetical protein
MVFRAKSALGRSGMAVPWWSRAWPRWGTITPPRGPCAEDDTDDHHHHHHIIIMIIDISTTILKPGTDPLEV